MTPLFTCTDCECEVFSLVNGANPTTRRCGKCERGEYRTDGYLDGYTESERSNLRAAKRERDKRGAKQAHKPTQGKGVRALRGRSLGY